MKLLSAPRQPFVGLALMAAVGIIVAEIVPLGVPPGKTTLPIPRSSNRSSRPEEIAYA